MGNSKPLKARWINLTEGESLSTGYRPMANKVWCSQCSWLRYAPEKDECEQIVQWRARHNCHCSLGL